MADAVPDAIVQVSDSYNEINPDSSSHDLLSDTPIPKTVITKVDSGPSYGEIPGTTAFNKRRGDADPDVVEKKEDVPG